MTSLIRRLPVAQWLERPTGVRKVMGPIPDWRGTRIFSLFHACDINSEYSIFSQNVISHILRDVSSQGVRHILLLFLIRLFPANHIIFSSRCDDSCSLLPFGRKFIRDLVSICVLQ